MKKYFLIIAVICGAAAQAHATDSCTKKAKHEGIGQLQDELNLSCNERSAKVVRGPTWHDITGYSIMMNCGDSVPNEIWVYLTSDCKDASNGQADAYENQGDQ